MDYQIDIYDTWGRRIASFDETPLLEVRRAAPDQPDAVRGILPGDIRDLGPAYRVVVTVEDKVFCDARVTRVLPYWGDARRLILDRYVRFHSLMEIEAERPADDGNAPVERVYRNRAIAAMVKDAVNSAAGPVRYAIAHTAYPQGAQREYQKFLGRKRPEDELGVGAITVGNWIGANRIDAGAAFARTGDTIAGLIVDGQPWPDLRLLMIDCEDLLRTARAQARHPETAFWTDAEYAASGYKARGAAAQAALNAWIAQNGIEFIELNPHRDTPGAFDGRVDEDGRYLGLVFGGGECVNAALVENGFATVNLYRDGTVLAPEMELKDFYSYTGPSANSIEAVGGALNQADVSAGLYEVLTALAYAAGGAVWSIDPDFTVRFYRPERPAKVIHFDSLRHSVAFGVDSGGLVNVVSFEGPPTTVSLARTYSNPASADEYGRRARDFAYFGISYESDAEKLVNGILDDVAYPQPIGSLTIFDGAASIQVGDVIELRGAPVRRFWRRLDGEWRNQFAEKLVARAKTVAQRFQGRHVTTEVTFTSPLRSVDDPLSFIVRSQPNARSLFAFRLDVAAVGLDLGYHLD